MWCPKAIAAFRKQWLARAATTSTLWRSRRSSFRPPTRQLNGPPAKSSTLSIRFEVISKDGFTMQLEVRVVFRVKPEDAPFMVAKIGGIERLIQNVMHPLIDSIFRNQASESSAMAYLQNRHEEQERAEARVRAHLLKYHVDVVNVLICHIHLPEELMKTQTEKILAEQRQNMYNAQREAEEKRIQLERTKSQADNQKDLMGATVGVEIAGKRAEQRKAEGEGEAHYIQQTGRAEAEKVRLMGEAQGVAYHEQVNALGAQGVALVEVLKVIGEKGVRITPDIMASGGGERRWRRRHRHAVAAESVPQPDEPAGGERREGAHEIRPALTAASADSKQQPGGSTSQPAAFLISPLWIRPILNRNTEERSAQTSRCRDCQSVLSLVRLRSRSVASD